MLNGSLVGTLLSLSSVSCGSSQCANHLPLLLLIYLLLRRNKSSSRHCYVVITFICTISNKGMVVGPSPPYSWGTYWCGLFCTIQLRRKECIAHRGSGDDRYCCCCWLSITMLHHHLLLQRKPDRPLGGQKWWWKSRKGIAENDSRRSLLHWLHSKT